MLIILFPSNFCTYLKMYRNWFQHKIQVVIPPVVGARDLIAPHRVLEKVLEAYSKKSKVVRGQNLTWTGILILNERKIFCLRDGRNETILVRVVSCFVAISSFSFSPRCYRNGKSHFEHQSNSCINEHSAVFDCNLVSGLYLLGRYHLFFCLSFSSTFAASRITVFSRDIWHPVTVELLFRFCFCQ